jgi:hypothetical protein
MQVDECVHTGGNVVTEQVRELVQGQQIRLVVTEVVLQTTTPAQ